MLLDYGQRGQILRYSVAGGDVAIELMQLDNGHDGLAYTIAAAKDGPGRVVVTPTGATINGQSSLILGAGQWARVWAVVSNTKYWLALVSDAGEAGSTFYPEDYGEDLQAAIDAASVAGGGTVFLRKYYTISAALNMKTGVSLVGKNMYTCGVTTTGNISAIRFDSGAPNYKFGIQLRNFRINLGTSTGYHIHFDTGEPWSVLLEDLQFLGGLSSVIQVDTGVNPFDSRFHRLHIGSMPNGTGPIINWNGGGSGTTMDNLYIEPEGTAGRTAIYLYTGDFVIGLVTTGRGINRILHNEYSRTIVQLLHYEPTVAFDTKADSIVFQQYQNGFLRIGGIIVSSGVSGNAMPNYWYKLGYECPYMELGPVFSYSGGPTTKPVYYTHGSQNRTQFYWGDLADVDKSAGGTIQFVTLGGLAGSLRVGSVAGGTTLGYLGEIYGSFAQIQNSANVLTSRWAYSYSGPASAYTAATDAVKGNNSNGVTRDMVQTVVEVTDPTHTSEDADWVLKTYVAGTLAERLRVGSKVDAPVDYYRSGTKVVGARRGGWTGPSGTATRSAFDTATVSTAQLAQAVKALIDDLIAHGLIGA